MAEFNFAHGHALRLSIGPGGNATIHLTPGTGLHRLTVTVAVTSSGLPEGLPIQLGGDLYMELTDAHRWLGPLHTKQLPVREFQTTEQLTCSLSDAQLRGIEQLRDGRDLPLGLHMDAVLLHPADGLYPVVRAQENGTVPAEAWARQLESLGVAVVMEVLVPLPFDGSEMRRAVGRIREAKGHITDGMHEEAVIKARAALDYVRTLIPHDDAAYRVKSRERTQAQRWSVLVDDLYSLASGANHDDQITEGFAWTRDDAVTIVSAVAGLLGRLK